MGKLLPVLEAFLPLIGLAAICFTGGWVLKTIIIFCIDNCPSAKFRDKLEEIEKYRDIAEMAYNNNAVFNKLLDGNMFVLLRNSVFNATDTLGKFDIVCPKINPNCSDAFLTWFHFLRQIHTYAKDGRLKEAREFSSAFTSMRAK